MSGRREFMMEKENTFIGKDDLIHCSVCKEPKQAWLPENDLLGVRLRYRQCACERDANAIEKAEQEEKERRVQIAKNRQNCFDEATMKNKTFILRVLDFICTILFLVILLIAIVKK